MGSDTTRTGVRNATLAAALSGREPR